MGKCGRRRETDARAAGAILITRPGREGREVGWKGGGREGRREKEKGEGKEGERKRKMEGNRGRMEGRGERWQKGGRDRREGARAPCRSLDSPSPLLASISVRFHVPVSTVLSVSLQYIQKPSQEKWKKYRKLHLFLLPHSLHHQTIYPNPIDAKSS